MLLNYNGNGNLVSDEAMDIVAPNKEWELLHDNVMTDKLMVVHTSTGGTGLTILDYTIQVGSKPWKTKLVFGSTVSPGTYFVTYYSQGDQNDADDLNTLASSVNSLVQSIGPVSDIQGDIGSIMYTLNTLASQQGDFRATVLNYLSSISSMVINLGAQPIPVDTTPPNNVGTPTISGITQTGALISWSASTSSDVSSYDIYQGVVLIGNTTGLTFNVTGLISGITYNNISIKAKDGSGNVSSGTLVPAFTTSISIDTIPPQPVTNLIIGSITDISISINWAVSPSSDVANYEIDYSSDGGQSYVVSSSLINSSSTSYTVGGLVASTNYTIRVIAIDTSGNRSMPATVSTATTAPVSIIDGGTFLNNTIVSTTDGGTFADPVTSTVDGGTF